MPVPVYLLAVAVFAMATSEFMLAGLVPDIAAGLHVSVGAAGLLIPAFAGGMIVGAPLMAALVRRWPARAGLLGFVSLFAAAHVAGALTTGFAPLLATRGIAALANAGFLAGAWTTTAGLVPVDRRGRALAVLLAGTTLATVAGVPGGAALGALLGWRATFAAIALLCLPAALGIGVGLPAGPTASSPEIPLRTELARLATPGLRPALLLGALVNAGTFATFAFLAPLVTDTAGLGPPWVPVALMLFGAGSFVGVLLAGRLADRRPGAVIGVGGPLLLLGWVAMAVLATSPVPLLALVFGQGALSFAVGGALITRALHLARGAPTMGGSYATAALNLGAVGGPAVAAATIGPAGGVGPVWVSVVFVATALLIALPTMRVIAPGRNHHIGGKPGQIML